MVLRWKGGKFCPLFLWRDGCDYVVTSGLFSTEMSRRSLKEAIVCHKCDVNWFCLNTYLRNSKAI